jgi:MacB-like periplasmic core domain/FtsX-like permease family
MYSDIVSLGLRILGTEWKRSFWVIAGFAIGSGLFIAISSLSAGYTRLVSLPFSQLAADCIVQRSIKGGEKAPDGQAGFRLPFADQPISDEEQRKLRSLAEVQGFSPAVMLWFQSRNRFSVLAGIDPKADLGPARVMGWISRGRKIEAPGETVVESHYARFNRIKVGDIESFEGKSLKVVGIATLHEGATVAAANYYISLADARGLAGLGADVANMIFIKLHKGVDPAGLQQRLSKLLPGSVISTTDSIGGLMKGFSGISRTISLLLAWVVLAFFILLSYWLIAGFLTERSAEIGLMKAVGWRKRDILMAFAVQTFILGGVGAFVGIGLGYLIAFGVGHAGVGMTLPWNLSASPGLPGHGLGEAAKVALPVSLQVGSCTLVLASSVAASVLTGIQISGRLVALKVNQAFHWT